MVLVGVRGGGGDEMELEFRLTINSNGCKTKSTNRLFMHFVSPPRARYEAANRLSCYCLVSF